MASVPGLAAVSNVSLEDCIKAIDHLSSPDEWSRTKSDGGRRIAEIDGGWVILNYAKYREKGRSEERREYFAEWKRAKRAELKDAEALGRASIRERSEEP